ncbi:MAG TPA: Nif3-like dinuclear metal center hexameric protein, partial [Prevotellaceae bacterium]|nr:Nif3-like dinuclear metal center hexameric protein [Prevotellaceae bacterium]
DRFFGWEGRIQIGVLGHYQSEQFTQQLLQKLLEDSLPALRTRITTINTNPIHYL